MAEKGSGSITLFGAGATFEGKITTPHMIQVYGNFSGEIHTSDSIIIGRDGVVVADITAKSAQVGGKIEGNIHCKEQIELEEHSQVRGDITAKELIIKKGALFHGKSTMTQLADVKSEQKQTSKTEIKLNLD